MSNIDAKIAIVGLGYVGLPLAVEFGKVRNVIGFDVDASRIAELRLAKDRTGEVLPSEFSKAVQLAFTDNLQDLADAQIYIVTVPTPIDEFKRPNLTPLLSASEAVGRVLKKGDIVIYESTVYPGATEEDCVPVLEQVSGLTFNQEFYCGYSPERINPGDKSRGLTQIVKVTSGSTPEISDFVDELYSDIITAGTYRAESIRVAEAAKVIENTQRDLNIALVNELAMIFNRMDIDTEAVLKAAATKWNFLSFTPGLVGGHCIGVDPYYLTHIAESYGYRPEVILSGRRINDGMGSYVASRMIKALINNDRKLSKLKILILGFAFKENCSDIRNTRVIDILRELREYGVIVDVFDPVVDEKNVNDEYQLELVSTIKKNEYDGIILAVAHNEFKSLGVEQLRLSGATGHLFYDLKSMFPADQVDLRL